MPITSSVLSRLRWHAGLEERSGQPVPSIAECTWPGNGLKARLAESVNDVIDALSEINHQLNGPVPSRSTIADANVPRQLVYAISEILRFLRKFRETSEATAEQRSATRFEREIEIAWSAVLSGDIDDLRQHISEEEEAEG